MREEVKTKIRAKLIDAIQVIAADVGENEYLGTDFFWADNTVAHMADAALTVLVAAHECCEYAAEQTAE